MNIVRTGKVISSAKTQQQALPFLFEAAIIGIGLLLLGAELTVAVATAGSAYDAEVFQLYD